jgi:hypothetical protein
VAYQFNWTTEIYSHGYWLRKWLGWPEWLPFPAYLEHGVSLDSYHAKHELANNFRIHFYWSDHKKRYASHAFPRSRRTFIQVPHPFLYLKNSKFTFPSSSRNGLLVFWPHTTSSIGYSDDYIDSYLIFLASLSGKYNRIDVCVSSHDIISPWVSKIEERYNIVSAGDKFSKLFGERLFALLDQYEFATSPIGGSEVAYCVMMGVKYFVDGPVPSYRNVADENFPLGDIMFRSMLFSALSETKKMILAPEHVNSFARKVEFYEPLLGVSANPSRVKLLSMLFIELLRLSLSTKYGIFIFKHYVKAVIHIARRPLSHSS